MGERSFDGESSWTVGRLDKLRATAVTVRGFAHAARGTLKTKEGICRNNDQLKAVKKGLAAFEGVYSAIEAALAECRLSAETPLGSALAALAGAAARWSSDDSFDGSLQTCGDLVGAADGLDQAIAAEQRANLIRWGQCEVAEGGEATHQRIPRRLDSAEGASRNTSARLGKATAANPPPPDRDWTQALVDHEVRRYKADRLADYNACRAAVRRGDPGASTRAQELFGRNAIARALELRSPGLLSKSPDWHAIARELNLPCKANRIARAKPKRIGAEIASEEAAVESSTSILEQLVLDETVQLIRASMPSQFVEATIDKLMRGEMTDDQARQLVDLHRKD